ncbi:MAG TPA: DUF6259 domain-containing protein [Thermoguttaceae bacterium]|nr:DUF6259 domain-containing protein [Thermoguttaceae bacterium]
MFGIALVGWIVLASPAPAGDLDDLSWREPFEDVEGWTAQPPWVTNASAAASVTSDGEIACFSVDEPQRGMKWSASMPAVALEELPYLVVRYRAEHLDTGRTDYLVYLDNRVPGAELHAIRLCDVAADGRWHVAAVDVTALTRAEAVQGVAVQAQADGKGKARLWLDWIAMMPRAPDDAEIVERDPAVSPKPDWVAPIDAAQWSPQPSWLGNPGAGGKHRVDRERDGSLAFRVAEPQRGMKWSWDLPEPVALEGHRYASMRYRATGVGPLGDYALCVLGKPRASGPGYLAVIGSAELASDGRWHTLDVDLRPVAREIPIADTLAIQVQAAEPDAALEVSDVRLANSRTPTRLADAVDWQPDARFDRFDAVPIESVAGSRSREWRPHLRLADWFDEPDVTAHGIPFSLVSRETDLAATSLRGKSEIRFSADVTTGEVYLLMLAAFTGPEERPYGTGKLRAIRDVDRFRIRLEYADGTADECLPMHVATKQFGIVQGPQVVVAAADETKRLASIVLCDTAKQAAFAVAAITARTEPDRLLPEALEESPPLRVTPSSAAGEGTTLEVALDTGGPPVLRRLAHQPSGWDLLAEPCSILRLRVDGREIAAEQFRRLIPQSPAQGDAPIDWYEIRGVDGLRVGVEAKEWTPGGGVCELTSRGPTMIAVHVQNRGSKEHAVELTAPVIGPYRLGEDPADAFYLVPKRGAALDNRPCSYRERYCGTFPVQFLDTFSPADGRGLALQTMDTQCLRKHFLLKKEAGTFTLGVEYPERTLKPGEHFRTAPTILIATDGDWRRGLGEYRRWVRSWYKPLSARKAWFREVFNFRQRFLWWLDPLYDPERGEFHLQRAVDEARREFGGIDYLHVFDWGNCGRLGRIYGRTGDHSPYEHLGGREAFRTAIAGVQQQGVPVGLYIEGYLLQERGKLGQEFGRRWQLVAPDGQGRYWPDGTEMFVCPGVAPWREVQASTYATKARELDVDGMYLDQFGFAGSGKDCWSKGHGHEVPSYAVLTERDCTRMVRERIEGVKEGVALYTEESPVDVTSQYQDGSFTYAMNAAQRTRTRVPLNVFRFAVPDFKTIEILYCDKPTGSWATGVRWVFFNGEAIWLEGPAVEWFEPQTRACIRRCYRILHKHRDAFTSPEPVPLAPTEQGGVFANAFPAEGKSVYTLYNSRHRTVRGPVLRLRHVDNAAYYDEWHERPAKFEQDGQDAVISLEIGPHDVGCLVVGAGSRGSGDK